MTGWLLIMSWLFWFVAGGYIVYRLDRTVFLSGPRI